MFDIGSISKTMLGTALMRLVDRGELDLDAEVSGVLPGFRIPTRFDEPIRIRHLLTHTTGMPDVFLDSFAPTAAEYVPLRRFLETHLETQRAPPGSVISYCNACISIGGVVAEQITGKSYAQFLQDEVFLPLDMRFAWLPLPDNPIPTELARQRATPYRYSSAQRRFIPLNEVYANSAPAGGVSASGLAMANYMIMHLEQGRWAGRTYLSASLERDMLAAHARAHPRVPGFGWTFKESTLQGVRYVGHSGNYYGTDSSMVFLPDQRFGYFFSYTGGNSTFHRGVLESFMREAFPRPHEPVGAVAADLPPASDFVGDYRKFRFLSDTPMALIWPLMGQWRVDAVDRRTIVMTTPAFYLGGGWARYVQVEPGLFRKVAYGPGIGAYLVDYLWFSRAPDGRVVSFATTVQNHTFTALRAPWWETQAAVMIVLAFSLLWLAGIAVLDPVVWSVAALFKRAWPEVSAKRMLRWLLSMSVLAFAAWLVAGMARDPEWGLMFGADYLGVWPAFYLPPLTLLMLGPLALVTLAGWRMGNGATWTRAFDAVTLLAASGIAYLMVHFGFVAYAFR